MSKRMFNSAVSDTGLFLMMPPSTQSLYFHLCTHADDDGIVDAYSVMRMTQSKEDDFAILVTKKFVTVLNTALQLIWINHWFEHNNIRAELITPSEHRELLVSVIPGVPIKESKKDADTKRRIDARNAVRCGQTADPQRVRVLSAKSPVSSIGEDSIAKLRKEKKERVCSLEDITEEMYKNIATTYEVRESDVKTVAEELRLYTGSTGKTYKDYSMTLQTWVRRKLEEGKIGRSVAGEQRKQPVMTVGSLKFYTHEEYETWDANGRETNQA